MRRNEILAILKLELGAMKTTRTVLATCLAAVLLSGCSVRRWAISKVGDALASGGSTYESDEDLQLVGDALPFGLKLIESLLAQTPQHRGLLLAACQGFTSYSYIYVDNEADMVAQQDLARAGEMRTRARRLYLRAHRYGLRGLSGAYPGIADRLITDPKGAVAPVKKKDVPLLYWTAAALGSAISVSLNDATLLARLPEVDALVERALALDESWSGGAIHDFQILFAGARPGGPDFGRIQTHFDRALTLSQGKRPGLFVAYAEAVALRKQNRAEFRSMLEKALAIDAAGNEQGRLANLLAQRRGRRLLDRVDELILEAETASVEEP